MANSISLVKSGIKGAIAAPSNIVLRKFGKLKPKLVVLMTTDLCNSRCIMCNIYQNKKTHEPLSPGEIKRTFSDPLFSNVKTVLNTGGELTVRTDLKEFMMAQHEALPKARLSMSTNAIIPQRAYDTAKYLLDNGVQLDVGVSLDGATAEVHDKIRGVQGNFDSATWLLLNLVELRAHYPKGQLHVAACSMLMDGTTQNMPAIREFVNSLNLDSHSIQWMNNTPFYNNVPVNMNKQNEAIINEIKSLPKTTLNMQFLREQEGKPFNFMCFALNSFCVLKSNGDIAPCLTHWDSTIGNVRLNTPSEIWKSKEAKEVREHKVFNCVGCVNAWSCGESFNSSFYPRLLNFIKHGQI